MGDLTGQLNVKAVGSVCVCVCLPVFEKVGRLLGTGVRGTGGGADKTRSRTIKGEVQRLRATAQ